MPRLQLGLTDYFEFYNTERPHQSLGNLTPIQVYQTATGGGARIVDKFKERKAFRGRTKIKSRSYHLKPKGLLS